MFFLVPPQINLTITWSQVSSESYVVVEKLIARYAHLNLVEVPTAVLINHLTTNGNCIGQQVLSIYIKYLIYARLGV